MNSPECPLGHGPLVLVTVTSDQVEQWECPECSVEIDRPAKPEPSEP